MTDRVMVHEDVSTIFVVDEQVVIRPESPGEIAIVAIFEGPKGDPGEAVEAAPASYVSGGVAAFQVVYMTSTETVLAANANNPTHAGRIVGIALETKPTGQKVLVSRGGSVNNPAWSLTPGQRYYLQAGGELGENTEGLQFIQKVGVADATTRLLIQIEPPVRLNG